MSNEDECEIMNYLVIGASGLVGYEFYRQKKGKKGWHFTYNTNKMDDFVHLDAGDQAEVDAVFSEIKPEVVIFPAAMPNVNKCETEPKIAEELNLGILRNVLEAMKKHGGKKIVFFSTDYLFDGEDGPYSEEAKVNPLNEYGRIKLKCEEAIKQSGLGHIIIRTTGIFGWEKNRKNFLYRVLDNLSQGKQLELPDNQYATPVYVKDLASATMKLIEMNKNGIYNVCGPDFLNRVELANLFADGFDLDKTLISGKKTSEFQNVAPRPLRCGLKIDKVTALGIRMMRIKEALVDMKKNKEKDDAYPEPG
ncbi:SDR family oxidoreductase [Candidatus Micrarchaeota archaeon]|nr:SDR family oxidoreductase [Candidatus Micrarchaeota archaeon]